MLKLKSFVCTSLLSALLVGLAPAKAQAGPLLDWLLGKHKGCCSSCLAPAQACAPTCPQPTVCQMNCTQTCQRVVVNYVPYTAYRTNWEQVPVTQYRQTCSTDPCTGCPVTCMKPCVSYSWQLKRVPYVTYRPVYRTESYSVPVTYTAMAPSTCSTCATCPTSPTVGLPQAGCSTCGTGYANPVISSMPTVLPDATLATNGTYTVSPSTTVPPYYQSAPATTTSPYLQNNTTITPADQAPVLGKPIIIDRREIVPDSSSFQAPALTPSGTNTGLQGVRPIRDPNPGLRWDNRAPATNPEDQTASAPTRRRWDYSPVRLASHTEAHSVDSTSGELKTVRGDLQIESRPANADQVNAAWKNLD